MTDFDLSHLLSNVLHSLGQTLPEHHTPDLHTPDLHHTTHHLDPTIATSELLANPNTSPIHTDETIAFTQAQPLSFADGCEPMVMQSAHSNSSDTPSVTVDSYGGVYLHKLNGNETYVGRYNNGSYLNNIGHDLGYLKDGVFYDRGDHKVGAFHGGCIFNSKGVGIGHADTAVEAGAYIFYVQRGGL
jgi:hypothetical protein